MAKTGRKTQKKINYWNCSEKSKQVKKKVRKYYSEDSDAFTGYRALNRILKMEDALFRSICIFESYSEDECKNPVVRKKCVDAIREVLKDYRDANIVYVNRGEQPPERSVKFSGSPNLYRSTTKCGIRMELFLLYLEDDASLDEKEKEEFLAECLHTSPKKLRHTHMIVSSFIYTEARNRGLIIRHGQLQRSATPKQNNDKYIFCHTVNIY